MKHAAAMKYGGELVAAEDCNYDSFKELVPLCPNCKEPVFLRTGGDRVSPKGTEFKIGPHWCHFKGVSDEQIASCESRVSSYTDKDRQRIAAQARGQRLKLLQRWFWSVYSRAILMKGVSEKIKDDEFRNAVVSTLTQNHSASIDIFYEHSNLILEGLLTHYRKNRAQIVKAHPGDLTLKTLCSLVDSNLHERMCMEVVGFLKSKSNRALALDCMVPALVVVTQGNRDRPDLYPQKYIDELICANVLETIMTIPWASEFQRLEAESKKGAA